jgi:hypothetical protein
MLSRKRPETLLFNFCLLQFDIRMFCGSLYLFLPELLDLLDQLLGLLFVVGIGPDV